MKILIEAPFNLKDIHRDLINDKMNSLQKYDSKIIGADVFFKLDDGKGPNVALAHIKVLVPGNDIFVQHSDEDAITAFNRAFDSIKRQVKKRVDKVKQHHSEVREMIDIVYDVD